MQSKLINLSEIINNNSVAKIKTTDIENIMTTIVLAVINSTKDDIYN